MDGGGDEKPERRCESLDRSIARVINQPFPFDPMMGVDSENICVIDPCGGKPETSIERENGQASCYARCKKR